MLDDVVIEIHWSNNPIPLDRLIEDADCVIEIPFGVFNPYPSSSQVTSVQGKTGEIQLSAADVQADPIGAAEQVKQELLLSMESISSAKLDKVDYEQHFRGVHDSYADLIANIPIAKDGDYAHIKESQNFGRLSAIWSGTAGVWNISGINIGSNTDEVPEGNLNLYFKAQRVLDVVLNGFDASISTTVTAADKIGFAIGKLQGQISKFIADFQKNVRNTLLENLVFTDSSKIKNGDSIEKSLGKLQAQFDVSPSSATWYNAKTIGTIHRDIDKEWTQIEFAKINGMLWIRGRVYGSISPAVPWVSLTNSNWYLNAPLTPTSGNSIPFSFLGVQQATGGPLIHHQFFGAQSTFYGLSISIASSFADKYVFINPTCLGELVVK